MARHVLRPAGSSSLREMIMPARTLVERIFRGEAARMLVAGNAAHADIGLEAPGSAAMGLLLVLLGQTVGFPVPRGGAGGSRGPWSGGSSRGAARCASASAPWAYASRVAARSPSARPAVSCACARPSWPTSRRPRCTAASSRRDHLP